jgi:hypothetical protein
VSENDFSAAVRQQQHDQAADPCKSVLEPVVIVSDNDFSAAVRQQQQDQAAGPCKSVLEPVVNVSDNDFSAAVRQQQQDQAAGPCKSGETAPWSLDWLSKQQAKAAGNNLLFHQGIHDVKAPEKTRKQAEHVRSKSATKKKKGALVKQSVGFMKKIARMPEGDRKQILNFLKKQKRSKKASKGKCQLTNEDTSTSESSKNSNSSVNKDWENWVILHGKTQEKVDDVKAIRKKVGLKFNCDTTNSFNLLTKEGRKELRAAGVNEVVCGSKVDGGGVVEMC